MHSNKYYSRRTGATSINITQRNTGTAGGGTYFSQSGGGSGGAQDDGFEEGHFDVADDHREYVEPSDDDADMEDSDGSGDYTGDPKAGDEDFEKWLKEKGPMCHGESWEGPTDPNRPTGGDHRGWKAPKQGGQFGDHTSWRARQNWVYEAPGRWWNYPLEKDDEHGPTWLKYNHFFYGEPCPEIGSDGETEEPEEGASCISYILIPLDPHDDWQVHIGHPKDYWGRDFGRTKYIVVKECQKKGKKHYGLILAPQGGTLHDGDPDQFVDDFHPEMPDQPHQT